MTGVQTCALPISSVKVKGLVFSNKAVNRLGNSAIVFNKASVEVIEP